jgi:alpha 1,2-mannosyltransferase
MMRLSQKRVIATTIILLLIIVSFLSWRRYDIPSFLPGEAPIPVPSDEDKQAQSPALDQRLEEFVYRQVLSYEESVRLNSATCPTEGINFDVGAVRGNEQRWREMPSQKILRWRQDIAAYLQKKLVEESSIVHDTRVGRGIVMAAGDGNSVVRARTNVRFLRSYNCTLPVEIFHFSNELSNSEKNLLSDLTELETPGGDSPDEMKVTVRVVEAVEKGDGWKAFEIKGAAIQQSSFEEILYLDTDSYLLQNPGSLFESEHWKETGLLLWPDYTKSHPTNPVWRFLGQGCRDEYEGESGQIVVSRSRHQDVLWLVEYFAMHHNDFYGFMGGDRDSFRVAALLLGKKWNGPGRLIAAVGGELKGDQNGGGHTMLQADPNGKWMFVHANLIKHGKFPRPLWQKIHRATNDAFEGKTTYGNIDPPNTKIGEGLKFRVDQAPRIETFVEPFEGYDESLVTVEDWDTYEELRGFEEKWFEFGGVH